MNSGIETGTFNHNPISTYSHSNYPSTIPVSSVASNNCMYEQHAYVDHQGGGVGVYLPWSHTPNNVGALLQRTYHYGNSNGYVPPQQHQPTSPEDRSDSAQSYVSSPPSCTSLHSPVASPVAVVANTNFAYSSCSSSRSNSNCNSPAGQQAQHQSSYQELYSPVSFNLNLNIKCFHSILIKSSDLFITKRSQSVGGTMNASQQQLEHSGSNSSRSATVSAVDVSSAHYFYGQNSPIAGNSGSPNVVDGYQQHQTYLPSIPTTSSTTKTSVATTTNIFSGGMESWLSYI